jgi:hypothetical protein
LNIGNTKKYIYLILLILWKKYWKKK